MIDLQVHSLLEQHEQPIVPPMTPVAQQPLATVEQVPPQTPAPMQQLPEEQLPHMENMGYDLVCKQLRFRCGNLATYNIVKKQLFIFLEL